MQYLAYLLATLVGISLGLIGSGGSILTVPILVYIVGVDANLATAYSLFIVGSTALVGGINKAVQKQVDFKTLLVYGTPSMLAVYSTRKWIVPHLPDPIINGTTYFVSKNMALMLLFSIIMIAASVSMIRKATTPDTLEQPASSTAYNYPMILLVGTLEGMLTGLVGAGGGFLIIPALVLLAKMPMKMAVGTSLFIIATKSLIGFLGDWQGSAHINWGLLLGFTISAIVGIFIGIMLSKKIPATRLKKGFGWFVLVMGIYIILKETILK